jgi:hypothetical protein
MSHYIPRQHSPNGRCWCGEAIANTIYLHFRYPRATFEPDAVDPWYVHGCRPTPTCGSAGCEAEAYGELLTAHPGADVTIYTEPGEGIFVMGDDEE